MNKITVWSMVLYLTGEVQYVQMLNCQVYISIMRSITTPTVACWTAKLHDVEILCDCSNLSKRARCTLQ